MNNNKKYTNYVIYLIVISTIIRGLLAGFLELGNDEVYYRLYALYPDWSHFDHPIMVGLFMQLTTINLLFQSEFFLRLGSVITGAINLWIIFNIGKEISDSRTGYYASLLYTASIYSTIITGVFILPDTPQSLFWLWAVYLMIKTVPSCPNLPMSGINMLKVGAIIGLGILSKYTTVFLWFGIGLYILIYNREWLKSKWLYISILITTIISLPILIWNIQNDFISFSFHTQRVDMSGYSFDFDYFFNELIGEILYNNPINYVLIIIGIVAAINGKLDIKKSSIRIILLSGIPIIITFLIFSLFRRTLPHWTAPGFTTLIPIAAVFVAQKYSSKTKRIPTVILFSLGLIVLTITLGLAQINMGLFPLDNTQEYNRKGKKDPSLDLFGYSQAGESFKQIHKRDVDLGLMSEKSILIGDNWFPLANFDYYAATPAGLRSFGLGKLSDIHKYAWINNEQGGFTLGMDAYYLTDSREFHKPDSIFYTHFEQVIPADTIQIIRGGNIAKRVFVYRLKNLHTIPADVLKVKN
ncbi:MAG: glycosyltransferase family 39 protein [Bacteroidetes bacterium]|nr:glycosyltransferase family 39 protein [Bacteroidota bacterium]